MNLITPREAQALLCVSRTTLNRWVRTGLLSAYTLPSGTRRYDADEVRRAVKQVRTVHDLRTEGDAREAECLLYLRSIGVITTNK